MKREEIAVSSDRTHEYSYTPELLFQLGISHSAFVLYAALTRLTCGGRRSWNSTMPRLADFSGVSERTICRALPELEEHGLITVKRNNTLGMPSTFTVHGVPICRDSDHELGLEDEDAMPPQTLQTGPHAKMAERHAKMAGGRRQNGETEDPKIHSKEVSYCSPKGEHTDTKKRSARNTPKERAEMMLEDWPIIKDADWSVKVPEHCVHLKGEFKQWLETRIAHPKLKAQNNGVPTRLAVERDVLWWTEFTASQIQELLAEAAARSWQSLRPSYMNGIAKGAPPRTQSIAEGLAEFHERAQREIAASEARQVPSIEAWS